MGDAERFMKISGMEPQDLTIKHQERMVENSLRGSHRYLFIPRHWCSSVGSQKARLVCRLQTLNPVMGIYRLNPELYGYLWAPVLCVSRESFKGIFVLFVH